MLYVVPKPTSDELTRRELEVLKLFLKGYSNKQIGKILNISHRTAEYHTYQIRRKWKSKTAIGMVLESFRRGMLKHFLNNHKDTVNIISFSRLSEEQIELIQLMVFDFTTIEIARLRKVSMRSVEDSKLLIKRQFQVRNDLELAAVIVTSGMDIHIPVPIQFEYHT